MTKEALKLALKFVEDSECGTADLEAALKEALAQPEQEPVAYPEGDVVGPCIIVAQEYRARRMKPIKTKEVA